MKIDPNSQTIQLTAHDFSKLLNHISLQSRVINSLFETLKNGPVKYIEFTDPQDYSFTDIEELNEDICAEFPDIKDPGDYI